MAFRRSLTARAKLFYQQQRVAIPLTRADRDDNDRRRQDLQIHDLRRGGGGSAGSFSRNLCGDRRFAAPAAYTPLFHVRNMSSNGEGRGAENVAAVVTDNLEMVNEAVEKAVEAAAPVANEVATIATGIFPMHGFQQLIALFHDSCGCSWWVAIPLSTILMRTLLLPVTILQTRDAYTYTLIRPRIEEIEKEIAKSRNENNPTDVAVGEARMRKLLNEYGLSRWKGPALLTVFSAVTVTFHFDMIIMNVVYIPELNQGGVINIFPTLTAFTFWRAMKCHGEAFLSNKSLGIIAVLLVPISAQFKTGILCSWITCNLYGLVYGTVIKNGKVKKMLGIPNIAEAPRFNPLLFVMPASVGDLLMPIQSFQFFFLSISAKILLMTTHCG